MRFLTAALVVLVALSTTVLAVSTSNVPGEKAPVSTVIGTPDGRVGGETIATATVIASLPFSDTASTAGHINDYDWVCPYTGSTSPDVVYSLALATDKTITIDLCNSSYDTKVYVVQDAWSNVIYCNDDAGCGYSGYQSKLDAIALTVGHTYYIVVDGYGGSNGTYVLDVFEVEPCDLDCPPGAMVEGEPNCGPNYVDMYNGGCNSTPFVFQDITGSSPITMCGMSGTFLYNGLSYRDTDWYRLNVTTTSTISYCCEAEFPLLIFFINGGTQNCLDYTILGSLTGSMCQQICLTFTVAPGYYWLWAGPSVFTGVPCGAEYIMTIDGYNPSAVENASWSTIKALYR